MQATILVIDDEITILQAFEKFLINEGCQVLLATNGLIGLEIFKREKPDLILSDLKMPVMSGLELLKEVKKISPITPFIIISGYNDFDAAITAIRLGAWDFIQKPIAHLSILFLTINKALEQVRLKKEKKNYQIELEKTVEKRTRKLNLIVQELHQKNNDLALSKKRYKSLFDNAQVGIIRTDSHFFKTIKANRRAIEILGFQDKTDFLQNFSIQNIFKNMKNFVNIDQLFKNLDYFDELECQVLRKNGTIACLKVSGILDSENDGINFFISDITQKKEIEKYNSRIEKRLSTAHKIANLGAWIWFIKENRTYVSEDFYNLFGIRKKNISSIEKIVPDIIIPEDQELIYEKIRQIRNTYNSDAFEVRSYNKDGEIHWFRVEPPEIYELDNDGNPLSIIGTIQDITELRMMNRQVFDSEQKFHSLFEQSNDGIVIHTQEGIILDVNSKFCSLINREISEIKNNNIADIFIDSKLFKDNLKNVFGNDSVKFESSIFRKDSSIIVVEVSSFINKKQKNILQTVIRDITDKKRANELLKKSEEKFRSLVHNIPDIILMINQDTSILFANKNIDNYTSAELINKSFLDLIIPDSQKIFLLGLNKSLAENKMITIEIVAKAKTKDIFQARIVPIKQEIDEKKSARNVIVILSNITSAKAIHQQITDMLNFNKKIISESPIGITIYNESGQCIETNQSMSKIVDSTRDKILSQNFHDIRLWKLTGLYNKVLHVLDSQKSTHYEITVNSRDGKEKYIEYFIVPFISENKRNLLLMVNDISELNRTLLDLKSSKLKLEESFSRLKKFNEMMTGREERILELKEEVNSILIDYGFKEKYKFTSSNTKEISSKISIINKKANTIKQKFISNQYSPEHINWEAKAKNSIKKSDIIISYLPTFGAIPIFIAYNYGIFAKNGLNVKLVQAISVHAAKNLLYYKKVDASQLPIPMSLAFDLGYDNLKMPLAPSPILNINGSALTVGIKHKNICEIKQMKGFTFGVPHILSIQYLILCNLLEKNGINPLKDVRIIEVTPKLMCYYLRNSLVDAIFSPEPYNQLTVFRGEGSIFQLSNDIWTNHPDSMFTIEKDFSVKYPQSYQFLVKSILEAQHILSSSDVIKKKMIAEDISESKFLNEIDYAPIEQILNGNFPDGKGNNIVSENRVDFIPNFDNNTKELIVNGMRFYAKQNIPYNYDSNLSIKDLFYNDANFRRLSHKFPKETRSNLSANMNSKINSTTNLPINNYLEKYSINPIEKNRINEILTNLSNIASGIATSFLAVTGKNEIGKLEILINDIIQNFEYLREMDLEEKENLVSQIHRRTEELRLSEGISLNMMEDAERARKEAEKANNSKSEFLANMSHEIRTPMNGIMGMVDILLDSNLDESQKKHLKLVKQSADILLEIINDILDFSKIEAGKMNVEMIKFNLREVVESVVTLLSVKAFKKNISIICDIDVSLPEFFIGDSAKIRQILLNLIGNAIKFTDNGQISIIVNENKSYDKQVHKKSHVLNLIIKDTGIGIPSNRLEQIFDSFSQADGSTTRKYGGTGLGLAISSRLSLLMGGELVVKSNENVGSKFTFILPIDTVEGKSRLNSIDSSIREKIDKFIIISDDSVLLKVISNILNHNDLSFLTFSNKEISKFLETDINEDNIIILIDFISISQDEITNIYNLLSNKKITQIPNLKLIAIVPVIVTDKIKSLSKIIHFDAIIEKPIYYNSLLNGISKSVQNNKDNVNKLTNPDDFRKKTQPSSEKKILIAEDNAVNMIIIEDIFIKAGVNFDKATNGKEAFELYKKNKYNIIFMDIQMPFIDGYELTKKIREIEKGKKSTIIIAMTAHAMHGDKEKCLNLGMDDYISKPFNRQDIMDKIRFYTQNSEITSPEFVEINSESLFDKDLLMNTLRGDKETYKVILKYFLTTFPEIEKKLDQSINDKNYPEIRKNAHTMNGMCGNMRIRKMQAIANKIENLSKNQDDIELINIYYQDLKKNFEKVKLEMKKHF